MNMTDTVKVGLLSAFIGSVTTIAASSLTYFNSSRELDIRMVNVALTILSAKEKGTDTEQARRYALRALETYGGIEIPDTEFEQWVKTGTVPAGDFPPAFTWDSEKYREMLKASPVRPESSEPGASTP